MDRQTLIDFLTFTYKFNCKKKSIEHIEFCVDTYLKSINMSECERQPVTDNKGNGSCEHKCELLWVNVMGVMKALCSDCGKEIIS